jgi:hypothetical protein
MTAWILTLMIALQPHAPWLSTYPETADAIARASIAEPLFAGKDGPARTAALLVAIGWFESRFQADAVGDHGRSVCLVQIGESNFKALGVTRETMLTSVATCIHAGITMIRESMAACKARPLDERLGHYAAGGNGCSNEGGLTASRHRMLLAKRLFASVPKN